MKLKMIVLIVFLIPSLAFAGEEELYASVPPADSAFVRTINLMNDSNANIQINGASFATDDQELVSNYVIIKQGEHSLSAGEKKQSITIDAKQYYTIVVEKDGTIKLLKDPQIQDPSKAMIYFYNLSDSKAGAVSVPSFKATVFEEITAGEMAARPINAVFVDLVIKADGTDVATIEKVELKRQVGTSVFLTGISGQYKAFVVQNRLVQ